MTAIAIDIRRLGLSDLNAIERDRAARLPHAVVALDVRLRAREADRRSASARSRATRLVGYVVNSRYVDAWHVMNVAVDPDHQRRGIATRLLERLFEVTADDQRRGYTLEVRVSNADAIDLYEKLGFERHGIRRGYYTDNREDALIMWRDAATRVILGIETSCDETAAAVITRDGEIRANVVASQAELHASYGGVVPEIASRRHLELVSPVIREALGQAGASLDEIGTVAVTAGPGLIGALLVGLAAAKAIAWARGLPLVPVNHLHGHVASLYLKPLDLEPPFTCLLASGGHTLLLEVADRSWQGARVLGSTLDDAAGEAFDKGARLLGLPLPGRRRDRPARTRGRPDRLRLPGRAGARAQLLLLGAEDRAPLHGARAGRGRARGPPARPGGELPARDRARPRRAGRGGGAGAARDRRRGRRQLRAPCRAARGVRPAARALHRQRCDDRLRRPLHGARPRPRVPCARCVCISVLRFRLLALAAIAVAAILTLRSAHGPTTPPAPTLPTTWRGLVGDVHPAVSLGDRMIVVLKTPSVAQRLAGGRLATEQEERGWTAEAFAAQQQVLTQLARHGLGVRPDYSYARVLDGFSASLDPRAVALLEHNPEVAGVYPVRAAFPETISATALTAGVRALGTGVDVPGLDGNGVTIALLDTGVDLSQPYLGGRVEPGIDIVGGTGTAAARRNPLDRRQIERHGTELAGLLVGSGGPGGSHGVAPGATVLPIRVAGWQPTGNGQDAVYARSDQVIAGLDRAADPNGDGDTHDAVRIALIGVAEPFAAFSDSPEAQAVSGALALDVLVVTPAGNSGAAGPVFGSLAGPAGSPGALSVGATDSRPTTSTVRAVLSRGLAVLFDGKLPLLDAVPPAGRLDLPIGLPRLETSLAGKAALVAGGQDPAVAAAAAVKAGASAVLVYGAQPPAGALGDLGVPVVGVTGSIARTAISTIGAGFSVSIALGGTAEGPNGGLGRVASFSSRGLTFDGQLAPQLLAPGVGILTADPGSSGDGEPAFAAVTGTSVAAASVAGAAALLFQERPGLTAEDAASLLTGAARAGSVDAGASAIGEVTASQTSVAFGIWPGYGDLPSLNGVYVDLVSPQTIGGNKVFSSQASFNVGTGGTNAVMAEADGTRLLCRAGTRPMRRIRRLPVS